MTADEKPITNTKIGADYLGEGRCRFVLWAPRAERVELRLLGPRERLLAMEPDERGYWFLSVGEVTPGTRYFYRLNDRHERPDPASRFQPEGVQGPSEIIDHGLFSWTDGGWRGLPPQEWILYELHVGAFTPEGTFAAIIPRLEELRELGITAIELMPVAQFPGTRNWGYDGVYPFAVQNSYGGPEGLKGLVDAAHALGLAVILDVVYNHMGPEGNYLREFGPYFTDKYRTPWGAAVNFDDAGSDEVRHFFMENARYWLEHFHVDALRLDAVHAIYDFSARPFLRELADRVGEFATESGRPRYVIAESDLNDVRVIQPPEEGGYGLDGQWSDDFHHALHTLLTEESQGYYQDFGRIEDLTKAFVEGFVYSWRFSAYRERRHGSSSADRPGRQFVVCSQNHDQIGNRPRGERLIALTGFEAAKVAAATVLFSPFVPLLFMGEEYGEEAPFLFFVSFADAELGAAVRKGRKEGFSAFGWTEEPPDPQAPETFWRSRPDWEKRRGGAYRVMLDYYREVLGLRRRISALSRLAKEHLEGEVGEAGKSLWLRRWHESSQVMCLWNFGSARASFPRLPKDTRWRKRLDSAASRWLGPGEILPDTLGEGGPPEMPPLSCALFEMEPERP